jgi:hypothetical protein
MQSNRNKPEGAPSIKGRNHDHALAHPSSNSNREDISPREAYDTRAACDFLGGISPRSLRRAELRGLIRPIRIFRKKLWARVELVRFLKEGV